ncbi:MAG: hypothetical protein ACLQPN_18905 [Bryobacteraceae bacterium]
MPRFIQRFPPDSSVFEQTISRSGGWRSPQLRQVVASIKEYLDQNGANGEATTKIGTSFNKWRVEDPKEFAARFAYCARQFDEELKRLGFVADDQLEHLGDRPGDDELPPAPLVCAYGNVKDLGRPWQKGAPEHYEQLMPHEAQRRRESKEGGKTTWEAQGPALKVAEIGVFGADVARHAEAALGSGFGLLPGGQITEMILLGVTGAGAGAFALPAIALAAALAEAGVAIRSWQKTEKHLLYLKRLRNNQALDESCHQWGAEYKAVHDLIRDRILPYIIEQKETKRKKKMASAFLLGEAISTYSVIRWATKGHRGVKRYTAAHWLAYHFCKCSCPLATNIVAGLTSLQDTNWLRDHGSYEGTASFLAEKMKSI